MLKGKTIDYVLLCEIDSKLRSFYDSLMGMQQEENSSTFRSRPVEVETQRTTARSQKSRSPSKRQRDATPNVSVIPTEILKYAPTEAADLSTLSLALCFAGANSSNPPTPFHAFVAQYARKKIRSTETVSDTIQTISETSGSLPVPIITVFNGPSSDYPLTVGKCRCIREILLVPKPDLKPEQICEQLFHFKRELDQLLITKQGILLQLQCRNGAASVKMDLPEQPIDLIHECLNRIGMSDRFLIGIDLASSSIFDESRGKYEPISGALKTADELVTFYTRLLDKYKDICLLVNPFRKEVVSSLSCFSLQDNNAWSALQKNVGDQVLLVTSIAPQKLWTVTQMKSEALNVPRDNGFCYSSSGPGVKCMANKLMSSAYSTEESEIKQLHVNDQFQDSVEFSGWMFDSLAQLDCFLVSELIQAVENLHFAEKRSIFAVDRMLTSELWPVDLAVGLGVHFLKIGGLAGEEHVSKLIHWMNIANSSDEGVTIRPTMYSWANFRRLPDETGET
ncbi:hypothetical protein T265_01634 [Opisthorchis viverrini]|uniref:phosphopyruvate hydratase n=1 Tax=Opisthorchis viverrini TaxID=6198 RepID=A0A075AIT6_OPIVI|nr:hypothetical protein T265_01634 [Opisthorchis viverrini]KER32199.1 hypothetical protein T265_01634 [Opisthorchis viverrini]